MRVDILTTQDPACQAFVQQIPNGKICHLPAWSEAVTRATKLKNVYLAAHDGNRICGVLPLVHVKSLIFGNFMVSQAFSDYGGPLADSPEVRRTLFNHAVELALQHKCEVIEFRNVEPLPYELYLRTDKVTMHLPLSPDTEESWRKFRPEIRNRIRKAEKHGLTAVNGGLELLDDFYRVWTVRMKQLGTPCYPRKLMDSILQMLPNNSRIFIVRLGSLTVGGGFTTCFNGWADMQWVATLMDYNKLAPNNLLYWSVIRYYGTKGVSWFDFGRCTVNGPTYEFKRRWGTREVRLYYQYWARRGHRASIASPTNPKYKRKIEAWKRLPLWTTRLLGPYISRNLP
jgi:serine/alanine adding enzyme